jgi:hypothetical protein
MSDIVKVLRGKYALDYNEKTLDQFCNEAADEIERLRAERDMLKRDNKIMVGMINDMGTIVIKARAALGEKE